MPSLRVLSVDAHSFAGDRRRLAAAIEDARPDVACVHGAPSLLRWRSNCAALARQAGLVVVGGGRAGGGVLLLSTLGVDELQVREITFGAVAARPPGAVVAALRLLGSDFVLAGARLEGDAAGRSARMREVLAALDGIVPDDPPVIASAPGAGSADAVRSALAGRGVAVGDGLFVDPRIAVDGVRTGAGSVLLELTLPAVDAAA